MSYLEHTKNFSDNMQFDILCAWTFSRKKPSWPLWFEFLLTTKSHKRSLSLCILVGRLREVRVYIQNDVYNRYASGGWKSPKENELSILGVVMWGLILYPGPGPGQPIFSREI